MLSFAHSAIYLLLCRYVNTSGCTGFKKKSTEVLCLSPGSLGSYAGPLLFQNHILCLSQMLPAASTNTPLSGSLQWPQWPRNWCEVEPSLSALSTNWAFHRSGRSPLGGLRSWSLGKRSASQLTGQMWAQTWAVCFSLLLPHHGEFELTKNGNSIGKCSFLSSLILLKDWSVKMIQREFLTCSLQSYIIFMVHSYPIVRGILGVPAEILSARKKTNYFVFWPFSTLLKMITLLLYFSL